MEGPAVALAPAVGATAPAAAAAAAAAAEEELAELRAANDASPADGTPWHDDTVGDGGGTAPKLPDAVESGYTDAHHAEFMERGFLQLGRLLPGPELAAMDRRIDEIMLGQHLKDGMTFQLDSGGSYTRSDMAPFAGPTRGYRRIEGLERDPLVAAFLAHPLVGEIYGRYYGDTVLRRRPVLMNKPAGMSTPLPWHQDVPTGPRCLPAGTPIVTIWTAIDAATVESGCMEMVPGVHKHGILNAGNFTSAENVAKYAPAERVVPVPVPAGCAVMFNNCMLHRSGTNSSGSSRRAVVIRPIFDMTR